jgi:hypothetical protein
MCTNYNAISNAVKIDTANPNRDGTGTIITLISGGSNYGTSIQQVVIQSIDDTTTAGMIRFFIKTDSTNWRLLRETPVPEILSNGIIPTYSSVISFNNIILEAGQEIGVSTQNSENFIVTIFGLDIISYT